MTLEAPAETGPSSTSDLPPGQSPELPHATQQRWDPVIIADVFTLIPKLIWPCILISVLFLFKAPISNALSAAALAGGITIDVVGFKLTLPKNEIPSPPEPIRAVLPKLDPYLIVNIVSNYGGKNRVDTCYETANDDEMAADSVKTRLKEFKLINFEKESFTTKEGKACPSASVTTYTRNYDLVRAYLLQVISSVKFSD